MDQKNEDTRAKRTNIQQAAKMPKKTPHKRLDKQGSSIFNMASSACFTAKRAMLIEPKLEPKLEGSKKITASRSASSLVAYI